MDRRTDFPLKLIPFKYIFILSFISSLSYLDGFFRSFGGLLCSVADGTMGMERTCFSLGITGRGARLSYSSLVSVSLLRVGGGKGLAHRNQGRQRR